MLDTPSIFGDESNQRDNVKVCIRIRPLNERELTGAGKQKCIEVSGNHLSVQKGMEHKQYVFDFVGQENIEQQTIYSHIAKPIADSCMQGYNGTIFAYGQTGAGKTFTI